MAKIETYACDICGVQKKESNDWWKVFLLDEDGSNKPAGFLIVPWKVGAISRPISKTELLPERADFHLCGAQHLLEWISRRL